MSTHTSAEEVRVAALAVIAALDGVHQAAVELERVAELWQAPRLYHVVVNEAAAIARSLEPDSADELDLEHLREELIDYLAVLDLAGRPREPVPVVAARLRDQDA